MSDNQSKSFQRCVYSHFSEKTENGQKKTVEWSGGYGMEEDDGKKKFYVLDHGNDKKFIETTKEEYEDTRKHVETGSKDIWETLELPSIFKRSRQGLLSWDRPSLNWVDDVVKDRNRKIDEEKIFARLDREAKKATDLYKEDLVLKDTNFGWLDREARDYARK